MSTSGEAGPQDQGPEEYPAEPQAESAEATEGEAGGARAESDAAVPPAKKRRLTPRRIAFWILVLVALAAAIAEYRARSGYVKTQEEFEQAWNQAQQRDGLLYRKDLLPLIHGSPSTDYDKEGRTETLTWYGIRWRSLVIEYGVREFVERYYAKEGFLWWGE